MRFQRGAGVPVIKRAIFHARVKGGGLHQPCRGIVVGMAVAGVGGEDQFRAEAPDFRRDRFAVLQRVHQPTIPQVQIAPCG